MKKSGVVLILCALVMVSCTRMGERYNKIYQYKPDMYSQMPAYITGSHFQNVSGVTEGIDDSIGYAHVYKIDDTFVPRGDVPSDAARMAYSLGGFAIGQKMNFKTYTITPGVHRITTEITIFGYTKQKTFQFFAQPGMHYYITGQSGGLTASVWLQDQLGNLIVNITQEQRGGVKVRPFQPVQPQMQQ